MSSIANSVKVTLLISFFSSMFQVDQRHGVLPAVRALGHVAQMPAFKATQADQIIQSIGGLKDDFKSQLPQTRIQIYQLIVQLVGDAGVASDLQYRHGASAGFMTDLMQMCRNERDPSCLMVWFDILRLFLQEYSPSPEVSEEIFNVFSAYFPISLRSSTTPSGITADDLKKALRDCFAANYRVAHLTVPYLVERLDQGDAITASVKVSQYHHHHHIRNNSYPTYTCILTYTNRIARYPPNPKSLHSAVLRRKSGRCTFRGQDLDEPQV